MDLVKYCSFNRQWRETKALRSHFNSVTFLSSVQTEGADITYQRQCDPILTHQRTRECKCLYSIAIFTSPFLLQIFWDTFPHIEPVAQEGSSFCPSSPSLLCAPVKHIMAVLLIASHTSGCCPQSLSFRFPSEIWSCCTT